jgi:predicted ribosomally synthesized peptide with SipW-like signal peptide
MRKKLVALSLVAAMLAIGIIGGTLAYFTATDDETNTFTLGNVEIKLVETDAEGNKFEQNQTLLPGPANDIAKVVSVTNTGTSKAYAWIEVWVPAALDGEGLTLAYDVSATKERKLGQKTVEGQICNGYVWYNATGALAKDASTGTILKAVGLDAGVKQGTDGNLTLLNGEEYKGSYKVTVVGVAIQADGFEDISAAIKAYYDEANSSSTETNTETNTETSETPASSET